MRGFALPASARPYVGEFLGTFNFLTVCVVSSVCLDGSTQMMQIATAQAFGLLVNILLFLPVSGAHFNPIVTVAQALLGKMKLFQAVAYIILQLVASLCAAGICWGFLSDTGSLAAVELAPGTADSQSFLCEAFISFLLVSVIIALGIEHRTPAGESRPSVLMPYATALTLLSNLLWAASISGACMNPARAFGPALLKSRFDDDGQWVYFTSPFLGSVVAVAVWVSLLGPSHQPELSEGVAAVDEEKKGLLN